MGRLEKEGKTCVLSTIRQGVRGMKSGILYKENVMKIYHKLVRDRIPEIIAAAGKKCITHTLSDDEYLRALDTKLSEEVAEYQADKSLEEMADVLEVLQTVCIARGYSLEELETVRAKKAAERGGFKDKIFLERVEEKE